TRAFQVQVHFDLMYPGAAPPDEKESLHALRRRCKCNINAFASYFRLQCRYSLSSGAPGYRGRHCDHVARFLCGGRCSRQVSAPRMDDLSWRARSSAVPSLQTGPRSQKTRSPAARIAQRRTAFLMHIAAAMNAFKYLFLLGAGSLVLASCASG